MKDESPARRTPSARRGVGVRADTRSPDAAKLQRTLKATFGIERLRPAQEAVIARVLARRDTLAVMPTGAGKSLCYQLPALHLPGTTVVVSPLIALMKDQQDKLAEAGIATTSLNSTLADAQAQAELERIAARDVRIVFVTPERLADGATIEALKSSGVALFVVDEAHCISQWGHDFRPAYVELRPALAAIGEPPVLALTATAPDEVAADIAVQLGREGLTALRTGVYRDNLHYRVLPVTNEDERVAKVIDTVRTNAGAGIVYTATVRAAESLHEALVAAGIEATLYHGRLAARTRHAHQDAFMDGAARVVVATNAFGLGIDKADIRFVLHAQMPASLEAYYQESGRGGRDGMPAQCTLLYDVRDKHIQQFFLARRYPDEAVVAAVDAAVATLGSEAPVAFSTLRAALSRIAAVKIRVALSMLARAGRLLRKPGGLVAARPTAAPDRRLHAELAQRYADKAELDREKLERMVFYAQTGYCRWRVLLEYFSESVAGYRCGYCDNCQRDARREAPVAAVPRLRQHRRRARLRAFGSGEPVQVPRYGEGRVQRAAGDEVTVEFADGAVRTFLASYVRRAARAPDVVSAAAD